MLRMPDWSGKPRYNIAPTQSHPIIRLSESGRECALARWGLVPSWAEDLKIGYSLINARAETVAEKPSFRTAFKRRRCLIPATGFYEWKKVGKRKQPFHIHRRDDGLMAFAGLWERWEKGSEPVESFTIITTAANSLMARLHDRMPVILPRDLYSVWLDPDVELNALKAILQPLADDSLDADPVGSLVGNVKNDVPECLEPVDNVDE